MTVSLKYLPIKMKLDPSESINNSGTLRVDVLDAADLPAADRNGYSDPYCKFILNGKDVYKTKHQNKTLHPAWNEFFECPVQSRTAAKFKVSVWDWDRAAPPDPLGEADINLELLEPFRPKEIVLALDGKSGALRLKMQFKPDYVTRSRQGSSTFSGTFATPGKIVGAPVKGVGAIGGGVIKGASFLRHGFGRKNKDKDSADADGVIEPGEDEPTVSINGADTAISPTQTPNRSSKILERPPTSTPTTPVQVHKRVSSFGGASTVSASPAGAGSGKSESGPQGTAMFMVQAASGYPTGSKVQVHIKQHPAPGAKGSAKEVYKTKAVKTFAAGGGSDTESQVEYSQEMFRVACSPDTQFQIVVKDDKLLGDRELGEAMFFINDSATGMEKSVKVGEGTVLLTTTFLPGPAGGGAATDGTGDGDGEGRSPGGGSGGVGRRSLLLKRNRDVSGANQIVGKN